MTQADFLLEATLRLISSRPNATMEEIVNMAKELSDKVFDETKSMKEKQTCTPLEDVLKYIDEHKNYGQTGSESIKIRLDCLNIKTVEELCSFGKLRLKEQQGWGPTFVNHLDNALNNLYGIEEW